MATARAYFARYLPAGVEDFRPLWQLSHSARTEWVLQLQSAPAAFLFRHDLHHGAAIHSHRDGHVAGFGESLPTLRPIIRRPPSRALDSLHHAHRIHRIYHRACDAGRTHGFRAKHEPHRIRHRRSATRGNDSGIHRDRGRRAFLDWRALHLVVFSPQIAARAEGCHATGEIGNARSASPESALSQRPNLATPLA